uniref:AT-rich interactive domain-containing protein 5A isoform X1 n=1 Tax=Solea senegalensis TaxID=28829 RepID=UPI001CD88041|nr:AT-rich interactive domain-containing protein 5A isoform X1 [Solea senegalensis]XP_043883055.1 AT-rich interactive domain-containing protein 5A isoform X1 [Solea senegalensis]
MAEDGQSETSGQTESGGSEDNWTMNQVASPPVIEIHDSTTECEEEARASPVQMEEKAFVSSLHSFMKEKGSPIERIPHLGFKQINLWRIYKAVEKRGGYESVTAQRLWKKVYDELGGSPGSTSAATCTRRHYERLVLPFERHIKGEEDKPLPLSKPRKLYKRNVESKVKKAEVKRSRSQLDAEMDSQILTHRSPEAACRSDAVMRPHSALWAATTDRQYPDCTQPNRDICPPVYALLPVPTSSPWTAHIPPAPAPAPAAPAAAAPAAAAAAAEVISPLEKKKRMAQASLNLAPSPQSEDKERPSVICCSQSPARASSSQNCGSSDGSPLPLSSSSSRSPSPLSVSSEDSPPRREDPPASSSELNQRCVPSSCSEDNKASQDFTGPNKDISQLSSQSLTAESIKSQNKDSVVWEPVHKYLTHPFHSMSTSSFTKVVPKSTQLLRPAPIRPSYKTHPSRSAQPDDPATHGKKLSNVAPWLYQTERRDKSRTMLHKVPAPQSLSHPGAALPVLCVLSSYDKSARDSRHLPPFHPVFLPNRMRLPQSQLMYHRIPMGPGPSALSGSAVYPYPYSVPLLNPQPGYSLPAMNPIYPHKL